MAGRIGLTEWLPRLVARVPVTVHAKLLAAFLAIVVLLITVGAVGLQVLSGVNRRAEDVVKLQRKIAAYRQLQHDTTGQLYSVSSALLVPDERTLDATLRQLNQFGYDLDRLQFVAKDEVELLGRVREDYEEFIKVVTRVIELIRGGQAASGRELQLTRASPLADRLERLTNELVNKAEADMVASTEASQEAYLTSRRQVIGFAIGSIGLALVLGYAISWSVIGPVKRMDERLRQIAAGDFSQRVLIENRDELGALAGNLNRMSEELGRLYRQLEAASRHKSEFLANMSHELRTPLNAIIGYSEMLQEEAADAGGGRFEADLQKINAAGRHLLELINAVLDLSKIEAGRMELYLESFAVANMVRDIAAVIQPLAEKNANRLEVHCPDDVGVMRADLTKLRQALLNLLSNACKFTEGGTVSLTVTRAPADEGDWVTFSVQDTGIGMTPDQVARLFQEFSQADVATTRRYGGTGLGLALSRRLCRMMGGDIIVASEAGVGSTFTMRLPAEVTAGRSESAAIGEATGSEAPAGAGTVLVIDDEPAVRELMQRFLAREGFRVVTAAGGEEGLRMAKTLRPAAITLDVMMPGLDGWAVLSALKADPDVAEIPVIMLTIVENRNLGYALGAADYLTKPLERDRLVTILKRYRRDSLPVLVVDDDGPLRTLLRRTLEREGCAVAEAENGRAALERIRRAPPALVLLDLVMPEMDGFEFVQEFRKHDAWRSIPIIIVTAKELSDDERRQLNGHVERILEKGAYTREALLREVRDLVAAGVRGRAG